MERRRDKCELCQSETDGLVPRIVHVEVEVKCCPQCVTELDSVEGLAMMGKAERRKVLQKKSYQWADGLNGKRVTVFWDEGKHPVRCSPQSECSARGTAYRVQNAGGGWGQVKLVLASEESSRITPDRKHPGYGHIDQQEYGLFLNDGGNDNWYALVSWGCRKTVVEDNEQDKAG